MTVEREATATDVEQALRTVIDPELGENVVDLGLIYHIVVKEGIARIEMTTTTRGCPATAFLKDAVQSTAGAAPGIHSTEVKLTYEPQWSPAMMSQAARDRLHMA